MKTSQRINGRDEFWESDLEQVEGVFLKYHRKITDLPIYLDARVPPQGSVLLDNADNVVVNTPTIMDKIILKLDKIFYTK